MPTHLALIALMLLPHWPLGASHREVSHAGGWELRVHPEAFRGQLACRLTRGKVSYQRQALVFRLGGSVDTSNAVYRIDAGPPTWARSDQAELARLGFALHLDDLDNPSGGLVRIPEQKLLAAHEVHIEARPNHAPAKFRIDGLATALEAARQAGCKPGDFQ